MSDHDGGSRTTVSLTDIASRVPGVLADIPAIVRGARIGLLPRPGSKTSIGSVFQDRAARYGTEFDGQSLARAVYGQLPPYALPLFVRVVESLEHTTTFKSRKVELRNQAYGEDVKDPLYALAGRGEGYVPYYAEYPEEVAAGKRPKG